MEKILARRECATCGASFNLAHIVHPGTYDMPALLPNSSSCRHTLGYAECSPVLVKRSDDTAETIAHRFQSYDRETRPVVEHYRRRGIANRFEVRKGLDDWPELLKLVDPLGLLLTKVV
jgi:adenylate kinase